MAPILTTAAGIPAPPPDGPLRSVLDELNRALVEKGEENDGGGGGSAKNTTSKKSYYYYDDDELLSILERNDGMFFEEQVRGLHDNHAKSGAAYVGFLFCAFIFALNVLISNRFLPRKIPQVDLHHWIDPLNGMDATIRRCLRERSSELLLLSPVSGGRRSAAETTDLRPASSMDDVAKAPPRTLALIKSILAFWEGLLRNATSKSIFQSVEETADLLAAADDGVADLALRVLHALAMPPALHKQQAPDVHQNHATALHSSQTSSRARIVAAARGYGTRATGLGLIHLVLADDASAGSTAATTSQQAAMDVDPVRVPYCLPAEVGQVHFSFYPSKKKKKKTTAATMDGDVSMDDLERQDDDGDSDGDIDIDDVDSIPIEISLTERDISLPDSSVGSSSSGTDNAGGEGGNATSKKRRRIARRTKSTAELFFLALERSDGSIPSDRLFPLLTDIRMAVSFWTRQGRVAAVERRLRALTCMLYTHPSPEVMSGYFTAQPELCVELVDLLRPTVSSASVNPSVSRSSTAATATDTQAQGSSGNDTATKRPQHGHDGISALSEGGNVIPYTTRLLALEALTALVARRDGASGGSLGGSARLSNVLTELGVGKGSYLGTVPTLIRFALASLGGVSAASPDSVDATIESSGGQHSSDSQQPAIEAGLRLMDATEPPLLSRLLQVQQALNMIDAILTLTSVVVTTPSGTSALTDCGLIPALLATVAMDTDTVVEQLLHNFAPATERELHQVKVLLRFVTAQSIQILDATVVTHGNAMTAFHDLEGVDVLTTRLSVEIGKISKSNTKTDTDADAMEIDNAQQSPTPYRCLCPSQRVLLYSIVTCLTAVFHQESQASTTATTSTGGAQLRKKELTEAFIQIMDCVDSYGGHLAALVATLLSDVMNSDPHIVHYVHKSGIAKSFLNMVEGKVDQGGNYQPVVPAVPELIMAIPNVIAALSLTEDGAKIVKEANPFPSLLRIFYHPNYAMPNSRCLLNEMTAIVGQGLDEVVRHVERLCPQVLAAVAKAVADIATFAEDLALREETATELSELDRTAMEDERTCLVQYILNIGHVLEQILHNEEHCDPFVESGGLDALLRLFPASMSSGSQFLTNVCCLSAPSVSTLHHSTIEESLSIALKRILHRHDPVKLIRKISEAAISHVEALDASHCNLFGQESRLPFALDTLPRAPLYNVPGEVFSVEQLAALSSYLRNVALVQWITGVLASALKTASQRSQESGLAWAASEREWKKAITEEPFTSLTERLCQFYQNSLFEICRLRTTKEFELDVKARATSRSERLRYRLRIVCPEGAVVRDGIEIDSCANVGSMEMGEIVESFDRCVNSSGILRYRTDRGWVSEVTRGHGREPIAEVISLRECDEEPVATANGHSLNRVEAGVPGLCMAAVSVLARGQIVHSDLLGALSRLSVQSVRSLPSRSISFSEGSGAEQVAATLMMISANLEKALNLPEVTAALNPENLDSELGSVSRSGVAMYYGCILNLIQACLFFDVREPRMVNLPLLVSLVSSDPLVDRTFQDRDCTASNDDDGAELSSSIGLFGAVSTVFTEDINDCSTRVGLSMDDDDAKTPRQSVSRSVAASLPPLVSILQRLMEARVSSSPVASIMSRIQWKDIPLLLGRKGLPVAFADTSNSDAFFEPERFVGGVRLLISFVVKKAWLNPDFAKAPPHLVHPIVSLIGDVMNGLEDVRKKKVPTSGSSRGASGFSLSDYFRQGRRTAADDTDNVEEEEEIFEPDEAAISLMADMGFDRDRALDALESTRSNRVEIAMEYALNHPPPSPSTIARRREERERRQRERTEHQQQQQNQEQQPQQEEQGTGPSEGGDMNGNDSSASANGGSNTVPNTAQPDSTSQSRPSTSEDKKDDDIFGAKAEIASWIDVAPRVSCEILNGMDSVLRKGTGENRSVDGNGDAEALTVVLCSFLLDLCNRYPDSRKKIASQIFEHLKAKATSPQANLAELDNPIPKESEFSLAALCHAALLFIRALPKIRVLILQYNITDSLVAAIHTSLKTTDEADSARNSAWLAPSLLLLDIMAQPLVAFPGKAEKSEGRDESGMSSSLPSIGEYAQVKSEHEIQARQLSEMSEKILTALSGGKSAVDDKVKPRTTSSQEGSSEATPDEPNDGNTNKASLFESIPAYFPLLPIRHVDPCLDICMKLLGGHAESETGAYYTPPGVAQATMLLLLRLLRTPKNSSKCRRMGLAEAILGLSGKSKFTGNAGLVSLIFRRLLEDETTLQAAMETEIRGTVTKLNAKKAHVSATPSIPIHSFIEAVTPLLCRDPSSFLKAMSVSVKVEPKAKGSPDLSVVLLTADERSKHVAALADVLNGFPPAEGSSNKSAKRARGKSPHRNASKKNSFTKKNKKERHSGSLTATESPATHVATLLMNDIITSSPNISLGLGAEPGESEGFLWVGNLLEILTDLALAVPACACAVHNYRPHRTKDKAVKAAWHTQLRHALSGCPNPPKTFVGFLLHSVLPQDRWSIKTDHRIWDRRKGVSKEEAILVKEKRARAFRITKSSQASARLVLALAARPGEGRKRVISDLVFALSGGRLEHGSLAETDRNNKDLIHNKFSARELHALVAWGELCLGLAAPRSSGKNTENNSTLNLENVRIMLEKGMVHALLYALHRVRLFHPMASITCGHLLAPLEWLTRSPVVDAVKKLVENEKKAKDAGVERTAASEKSATDNKVVTEVDKAAEAATSGGGADYEGLVEDEGNEIEHEATVSASMEIDGDGENEQSDDEELSSGESSEEESSDLDEDSEDTDLDDMDSQEDDQGSSESSDEDEPSDDVEEEGDWNVDYPNPNDFVPDSQAGGPGIPEFDEEDGTERLEQDINDGWTRIESSAFGGMLLGGRGTLVAGDGREGGIRARGFIDAAEAMIGSLLRSGDISNETLAELEGSLGIRIMNPRGTPPSAAAAVDAFAVRVLGGGGAEAQPGQQGEVTGTLPHVHQRTQPDVGYSAFGGGGRWTDINSMEFVFGGPSVTAGSLNYDLVTGVEQQQDNDAQPQLTQLDLQLFPGGPAAASATRSQHALHPLLCGVDLPPVNALVSDLLPHGVRATRFGQMTTRRPGDWTGSGSPFSAGGYLVSTSNGNIIRSNRTHSGALLGVGGTSNRSVVGPVGWTDDGLPVDATVEEFTSAFERALTDATRALGQQNTANGVETNASDSLAVASSDSPQASAIDAHPAEAPQESTVGDVAMSDAEGPASQEIDPAPESQPDQHEGESPTDGDGVASSLAEGLRLSPGSEPDVMSTTNAGVEDLDREDQPASPPASTAAEAPAQAEETEQHEENRGPDHTEATRIAETAGSTNEDTQAEGAEGQAPSGDSSTDQGEAATENRLECPPDVDPEVFSSLPIEMQQDCVNQYNATQELASQLDGSSLDPEVLAALPEDMRREVIEQEQRERRMREQAEAPADPSQAEEMDNASFLASVTPELREEILLTADETFLNSLPASIQAEAAIIRERVSQQAFRQRHQDYYDGGAGAGRGGAAAGNGGGTGAAQGADARSGSSRKRTRSGKMKVECDREQVTYFPETLSDPVGKEDLMLLIRLMYLLTPVRPARVLQKVFQVSLLLIFSTSRGAARSLRSIARSFLAELWIMT